MAEVAIPVAFFLVESVLSFLPEDANSKKSVSCEVQRIKTLLLPTLRAYLQVNSQRGSRNQIQENNVAQVRDIVHNIEDALDEFMFQFPSKFHSNKTSKFYQDRVQHFRGKGPLRELRAKISAINETVIHLRECQEITNHSDSAEEVASTPGTDWKGDTHLHSPEEDKIFGFENRTNTLLEQLVREEQNRHMEIYVVGAGGFGKSTLVRIAYLDKRVTEHFDCWAWVPVTESFNETWLFDDMLVQFQDKKKESSALERGDGKSQVRSYLQDKRYLVVLDDICNRNDLQSIERFLPKNAAGSRIIITTHRHDVVVSHNGSPHRAHDMSSGLYEEAAWALFSRKAFSASSRYTCPPELVGIARKILSKCRGSPYAIVSVSRLIAMKAQLPAEWQAFHDTLGSEIGTDPGFIVSKTLLRSYKSLSGHLKSCFLYLSVFPENYPIERGRLIRLWLAEGFVEPTNAKTLERVAEDYLDEMIDRNLIRVTVRDFSGRAIRCGVDNLVHLFLINKSNEENFVTILSEENAETSNAKPRRISLRSEAYCLSKLRSVKLSSVRSSFVFTRVETFQPRIGNFISQFKLLKVLDLQGSSLLSFPAEICQLTLLRYLSLRGTPIKTIPHSIDDLVYIETLDLKQTQVRELPKQILRLPNLRYLLVYLYEVENYVSFDSAKGVELYPEVNFLSKLLKLTLIKASDPKFIEELGYLTKLRKLGIIDLKTEDGAKLCTVIQKMKQLSTLDVRSVSASNVLDLHNMPDPPCNLQRLYLKGRLTVLPDWISSLNSLVRIRLLWSKLPNSPIPALQVLPNLIELHLLDAYIGKELIFRAGNFSKLRVLHIEEFIELTSIIIEEGAMRELGKLVLCKCKSLNLPPLGIGNLGQLNELHALDMNKEFNDAVRPTSDDYWMVRHIPVITSVHAGRKGEWISN